MKSLLLAFFIPANAQLAGVWEKGPLPADVKWETNETDPTYADPNAKKGGTFRHFDDSFPLTLRTVGPDSNSTFRTTLLANQISLTYLHPNTRKPIPGLASHWGYGADQKTIYFKLQPNAVWSDGKPVTSDDWAFALEFMRSKHIVAPWYNTYYTEKIDKVIVIDDKTFGIVAKNRTNKTDFHIYIAFGARHRGFHKLDENWVRDTSWKIEPNTGPYQISKIEKGKEIVMERKKDWWGKDLRFFKNRYNVDRITYPVIRDRNIGWEHFRKGELDGFPVTIPTFWHDKAKGDIFDKGYAHKLWFYTDRPQPTFGMWLNQDVPLFKDKDVRLGFQHAMNVDKMLKTVLRGDYERLNTYAEGHGPLTDKTIKAREFDLAKAEQHLTKAGWGKRGPDGIRVKDGQRLTARVTYGNGIYTDRIVVLKEEAKKAGIELTMQLLDGNAAFKTMLEKKHEIAFSGWAAQERPEYWSGWHSSNAHKPQNNNFTNTDDPELDKLIDAFREEFDEAKQADLSKKIQRKIWEGAAFIPQWKSPYYRAAYWRWLRWPTPPGTKSSEDCIMYHFRDSEAWDGLFWIDEDMKKETLAAMKSGKTFPAVTKIDTTYKPK